MFNQFVCLRNARASAVDMPGFIELSFVRT